MRSRGPEAKVLLVEDDPALREATVQALELADFEVIAFERASPAARYLSPGFAGCVVTDIRMEGMDGLQLFAKVRELDPDIPVILMTGHGDIAMAVRAMHDGAFDFLAKPFATDHLVAVIRKALQSRQLVLDNRALRQAAAVPASDLVSTSRVMAQVRATVAQLARTELDVLIRGEAGTGKELWARELHRQSGRHDRPFVALSAFGCARDEELRSAIAHAQGGLLFLDGGDALPEFRQAQLVAALDARDREGTNRQQSADFRLVVSTVESDDGTAMTRGLQHRIGSVEVRLPPLRERRDDIAPLFAHFVAKALAEVGRKRFEMSAADRKRLLEYDWPGNVRELRSYAFAAVLNLPRQAMASGGQNTSRDLAGRLAEFERMVIVEALEATRGNVVRACQLLGTPRKTLYEKLNRLSINPSRFRS